MTKGCSSVDFSMIKHLQTDVEIRGILGFDKEYAVQLFVARIDNVFFLFFFFAESCTESI